jgi:competence protein ComEA
MSGFDDWVENRKWELGLMLLGLVLTGLGIFIWRSAGNTPGVQIVKVEGVATGAEQLTIDVSGAVNRSGVYTLPPNTRVEEAIIAAGGLSAEADVKWFEANVNRARKITDGEKIYIPKRVEDQETRPPDGQGVRVVNNKISINGAGVSELDTLPGIGPVTAQKIIDGRPYQSLEELLAKKVVGQKVFDQIKERISLW